MTVRSRRAARAGNDLTRMTGRGLLWDMAKTNGKTTHFEQIPVTAVEQIAIADVPDDREGQRRAADQAETPAQTFHIRRAVDRRKSIQVPPPSPIKES